MAEKILAPNDQLSQVWMFPEPIFLALSHPASLTHAPSATKNALGTAYMKQLPAWQGPSSIFLSLPHPTRLLASC